MGCRKIRGIIYNKERLLSMDYEIYWDDLKPETQKELLELMGDNGNFDVIPIATFSIGETEMVSETPQTGPTM